MKSQMVRSLTFQDGRAEEAMKFYISLFKRSHVFKVSRWSAGSPVKEGKIMKQRDFSKPEAKNSKN